MQPDLPDPVVPAMSRCGMRARSVQTAVPRDVFAEPDRERARRRGQVVEDVAEGHEVRREIRDLDADGLLAGNRSEDPDLGRREGVREVVLQGCDLRDLRAGRELQLVARDARSRDLADDVCVDAEVLQGLDERRGSALGYVARDLVRGRGAAEDRAVRQRVFLVGLDLADVEEARLVGILGRDRLDQERRGLVLRHDVRKVVHDVHRRFE